MAFHVSLCAREKCSAKQMSTKTLVFTVTVLAGLAVVLGTTPVLAQSPSFPDFSSVANLTLNPAVNGAHQVGNVLRLTDDVQSRVGTAWFNIKQPVAGGFTTTFTFQISHEGLPADGIAFVIQNSQAGLAAFGDGGGGIGYQGIPNSLAVEFDTYLNAGPGPNNDPNANHVAIQSCGLNPNSADHAAVNGNYPCQLAMNANLAFPNEQGPINLSDGAQHTATISYTPPTAGCPSCFGVMNVTLDDLILFPDGVQVNLGTLLNLDNGTAWVGFTGGTGFYSENNDILNWDFSPVSQTITQPAPKNTTTTYTFGSYLYKVTPDQNIDQLAVTAVLTDPATFAADRQAKQDFPGAQCTIYSNTAGKCVEFHAACNSSNGACTNVNYDVATSYDVPTGPPITNPGFLKATGQDCVPGIAFDSNIITAFTQTRTDPTTKGTSKPSFSCFVAVQNVTYSPADLDIVNLASSKVKQGANLTYVATTTNFGPSSAQGVAITNTIPAGTTYVTSSLCTLTNGCSSKPCTFSAGAASCTVGNMDKFGLEFMVVTVKVNATVIPGTILTDRAAISAFNPDPDRTPDRSWTTKTTVTK
jgi:uncharacterized repeat protein (TIGR01451 family)